MLELISFLMAEIHFGFPLAYYWYVKTRWLMNPWNIKADENYKPKITIIIPTYEEAEFIEQSLGNLYAQDYPKDQMATIVIDGGSQDGTSELVEKWAKQNPDFYIILIRENVRQGKLHAINMALKHVPLLSEVVIFTDADAYWEDDALSKVLAYFADPTIGSVTSSITYHGSKIGLSEGTYRNYYNTLRVAESKKHATPVHNGPLIAIRMKLLQRVGLPNYPGSDDSGFGSFVAFMGYRAIQVDDVMVRESVRGSQFRRRVRRAQHLLLNFLKTKRSAINMRVYVESSFNNIWNVEWWLHVINPWLLVTSCILLVYDVLFYMSMVALVLLGMGLILFNLQVYRMWMLQQVYLIVATLRNLWTKEIIWRR